jgi:hypothetical protein
MINQPTYQKNHAGLIWTMNGRVWGIMDDGGNWLIASAPNGWHPDRITD